MLGRVLIQLLANFKESLSGVLYPVKPAATGWQKLSWKCGTYCGGNGFPPQRLAVGVPDLS